MSTLFSRFFEKNNEIAPQEAEFTEVLGTIAVVPKMLYFYGKIPEKRVKTVAIVGTRRPTEYGRGVTYQLAYAAAQAGAVVVSGLAYGLDSVAHRAALDAGGVTLVVLGTPIDEIYPRVHERLAAEIVEKGGAVLSELAPGEVYHRQACFLQRNRIIAGLADVVVIAEAAARSGSLNTAAHALEQGREVMAVPGDIRRPLSEGCNRLIRQGAMPCLGTEDLLDMLFPERRRLRLYRRRGECQHHQLLLWLYGGHLDGHPRCHRYLSHMVTSPSRPHSRNGARGICPNGKDRQLYGQHCRDRQQPMGIR